MKKIFLVIALLAIVLSDFGCSICGCRNLYMGLFPIFKSKFTGIRYSYSEFHTTLLNNLQQFSHNFYKSAEIWSGINIGRKWQLLTFLPYYYNIQRDDDMGTTYKSGIGDITVLANYKIFDTRYLKNQSYKASQQIWVGGGIKLPTGSFNINVTDMNTTLADINAQIGTGSVDFFLTARHDIQIDNFGINTIANYKISTPNQQHYQYGNKLTVNSIAYYRISRKKITFVPNAGIAFENIEGNKLNGNKIILSDGLNTGSYATGGYLLTALTGIEVTMQNITIGANIQFPLAQKFAAGQTTLSMQGMVHLSFAL